MSNYLCAGVPLPALLADALTLYAEAVTRAGGIDAVNCRSKASLINDIRFYVMGMRLR